MITRVLFLVDRIALAGQAEDAFGDHLRDYPCHVLRPGRGFDRTKRITIATLQTMINEHGNLSSGYFDLVITDECHRSIYGQWNRVLRHFDSIQLGLTATPCTADAETPADPEDGRFVRDTLRFFELKEPTFRYTLPEAVRGRPSGPLPHLPGEDGEDRRRRRFPGDAPTSSTGPRWTPPRAARSSRKLFAHSDHDHGGPAARWSGRFTIPERNRAMVREFRDAFEKGFMGRDGIRRTPDVGQDSSCSQSTKRHAETLAAMFDEHISPTSSRIPQCAMPISW